MASRYKRAKDEEWKANFEFLPLPNSKVIRTPTTRIVRFLGFCHTTPTARLVPPCFRYPVS